MPLHLDTSVTRILTRTEQVPDPDNPGKTNPVTYPCDFQGNRLSVGAAPLKVFSDVSGKSYVQVAEKIPRGQGAADRDAAKALNNLKPVHFASDDGNVHGFFVEAPNFDSPAAPAPADSPAAPAPAPVA